MATNPVVSMPDADQIKRALEQCEFVVVSDICKDTDTTRYADVLLPAFAWGEKDGTVTNSERLISRQRAFLNLPVSAKADWWAVSQVAKKMGFAGFDYNNSHEIFLEHARLSAEQNSSLEQRNEVPHFRYFNLKGLTDLTEAEYDQLKPVQWPIWTKEQAEGFVARLYNKGQFSHPDAKAKFIATTAIDPVNPISKAYPLILNTGRIRDQWHTMSRTGLSANLSSHRAEPYCEIHPQDALKFGVKDAELLELQSEWGSCILRTKVSDDIRRGQVFAPIHWTDQVASDARIGKVVNPVVDPISGEPEFKHTPVIIHPFFSQWQGVFYVRQGFEHLVKASIERTVWWTKITTAKAIRYELADRQKFAQTTEHLKALLPFQDEGFEWLNTEDQTAHISHSVILQHGQLIASLYIAPYALLPDRDWVASLFKRERLSAMHRKALLAGQPMFMVNNEGALVCSCFKVGKNRIIDTIKSKNITNEKQVTACLKAGGNCGSCLPEIRGLIKSCQMEAVE